MPYEPWLAGMRITAGRLAAISPTWQDWTPTWSTSTGNNTPTFGDATITARYAVSARTVFWRLEISFGATTNFGGGGGGDNWLFSLPVPAATAQLIAGFGECQGGSPNMRVPLRPRLQDTTTVEFETSGGSTDGTATAIGLIDAVTPFTWDASGELRAFGQYESDS